MNNDASPVTEGVEGDSHFVLKEGREVWIRIDKLLVCVWHDSDEGLVYVDALPVTEEDAIIMNRMVLSLEEAANLSAEEAEKYMGDNFYTKQP